MESIKEVSFKLAEGCYFVAGQGEGLVFNNNNKIYYTAQSETAVFLLTLIKAGPVTFDTLKARFIEAYTEVDAGMLEADLNAFLMQAGEHGLVQQVSSERPVQVMPSPFQGSVYEKPEVVPGGTPPCATLKTPVIQATIAGAFAGWWPGIIPRLPWLR
jgi:hypothetical protein